MGRCGTHATKRWSRAELATVNRILASLKDKAAAARDLRLAGQLDVDTETEEASEPEYKDLGKFKEAAFRETCMRIKKQRKSDAEALEDWQYRQRAAQAPVTFVMQGGLD
ncbi:hypothetical protein JCM10207_004516 [Rhodosporidiobolus poonsookiae]